MRNAIVSSMIFLSVGSAIYVLLLRSNSAFVSPIGILLGGISVFLSITYYRKLLNQFLYLISLNAFLSLGSSLIVYCTSCMGTVSLPYCNESILILSSFPLFVAVVIWLAKILTR